MKRLAPSCSACLSRCAWDDRVARRGLADPATDADPAGRPRGGQGAGQRHRDLLCRVRRRAAGDPAARRPRQLGLLGRSDPGPGAALPGHRHGQPRPRPQHPRRAALRLRPDGLGRDRPDGPSEARQGRHRRLERRGDHRARHRHEPSRPDRPAVLVRRQLDGRRPEAGRPRESHLRRLHRARRRGVQEELAHTGRVRGVPEPDRCHVGVAAQLDRGRPRPDQDTGADRRRRA